MDNYKYEKELWNNGIEHVAGVDEVGRGPLIGPVVTACVVLPHNFILEGLTDSKKLSEKKRDMYYDYIMENAIAVEIGLCTPEEIDEMNIYSASREAMIRAINKVRTKVNVGHVLSDAMPIDIDIPVTPIVKGDLKSITISAASVIAKVTRDRMMYELDEKYPLYGFKNHKGYPTKKHLEAISKYGLIEGYRKTYGPVKKILEEGINNENK
jgi:ribonuclease HII